MWRTHGFFCGIHGVGELPGACQLHPSWFLGSDEVVGYFLLNGGAGTLEFLGGEVWGHMGWARPRCDPCEFLFWLAWLVGW